MNIQTIEDLKAVLGDEIDELFREFLKDSPPVIQQLEDTINANDLEKIRELAHYLKGSGGNIGAQAFADACKELELQAKNQAITNPDESLKKIKSLYKETESYMKSKV